MGTLPSADDVVKLAIAEGFHRLRPLADLGEWRGQAGGTNEITVDLGDGWRYRITFKRERRGRKASGSAARRGHQRESDG